MVLSQIDTVLLALSVVGQSLLFLVLWRRQFYREFPVFFAYVSYTVFSDFVFLAFMWSQSVSKQTYFIAYFANNVPEFLLQLGILYEVARSVLNPVKGSLPKPAQVIFAVMVASATVLACFLSVHSMPRQLSLWSQYFVQMNFTVAILRLVIFSTIVFFSQMFGIGWNNHVVQIASGFAGYSMVVLLVELLHRFTGVTNDSLYHMQEQFRITAWCLALGYWSYALAKKEAPRKEFSPKMASFLVSISSAASRDRAAAARLFEK
jgi:hypothetical protein